MIVPRRVTIHHRAEPVLGSRLDCRVTARTRRRAARTIDSIVTDLERWEQTLSAYRSSSELRRWTDGVIPDAEVSTELSAVLERALYWERVTERVLSPLPDGRELADALTVDAHGRPQRTGDLAGLRLDAFAKGYVVDRVVEAAVEHRSVIDVLVGIGGDVRSSGPIGATVGIEHPGRPFDNEPPIARLALSDAACATSGRSRRGDHLLDGRTGTPIAVDGSTVAVAATLEAADAWATSASVDAALRLPSDVAVVRYDMFGAEMTRSNLAENDDIRRPGGQRTPIVSLS